MSINFWCLYCLVLLVVENIKKMNFHHHKNDDRKWLVLIKSWIINYNWTLCIIAVTILSMRIGQSKACRVRVLSWCLPADWWCNIIPQLARHCSSLLPLSFYHPTNIFAQYYAGGTTLKIRLIEKLCDWNKKKFFILHYEYTFCYGK